MSAEYNSELISKLYNSRTGQDCLNILDEMEEIGDAIFVHPILDAFLKFRNSSVSHYFISALGHIKSESSITALDIIISTGKLEERYINISWAVSAMGNLDYFSENIVDCATSMINNYLRLRQSKEVSEMDLSSVLYYLKQAKKLDLVEKTLKELVLLENIEKDEFTTIFTYLTEVNPTSTFNYLVENYSSLEKKENEKHLSKQLKYWKGGNVDKLRNLILKKGSNRSKEIIATNIKEKEKKEHEQSSTTQKKEELTYGNSKVVDEIIALREKVNNLSLGNQLLGLNILEPTESIVKQTKSATSLETLLSNCVELRVIISALNPLLNNHGLTEDQVKKLLPTSTPEGMKKSLNSLYLYLTSRNIEVDRNLYGFRDQIKFTDKFAHPNDVKGRINALKKMGVYENYTNEEWDKIHTKILNNYKSSLKALNSAIEKRLQKNKG